MSHSLCWDVAILMAQLLVFQDRLLEVALGFLCSQCSDTEKYKSDLPGMVHATTDSNAPAAHMIFEERDRWYTDIRWQKQFSDFRMRGQMTWTHVRS